MVLVGGFGVAYCLCLLLVVICCVLFAGRYWLVGVCVLIVLVFSFIFWFGLIALLVVWLELVGDRLVF